MDNYYTQINSDRLRAEIKKRGLNMADLSIEAGYSESYISRSLIKGEMRNGVVNFLDREYGINPEKYVIQKDAPAGREDIDIDEFIEKIYVAIFRGVRDAMEIYWR